MSYVGNPLATAFAPRVKQDLTGQSGTSFTLSHAVSSANDLSVYINHVRQEPTTAYSVNGTTLTTTGSVASTDDFYIIYDELAVQSISHPTDQALTATSGTFTSGLVGTTATFSGAVSGTTGTFSGAISGTLGTAAQPNITSVGTLTGLTVSGDTTISRTETNGTVRLTLSNTGANGSTEYSELKLNSTAGGTQTSVVQHRNNYGLNIGTTTNHAVYLLQNNATALTIDTSKNVKLPNDAGDFTFTTNSLHIGASADIKIGHTNNNNVILSDNGMPFNIYTDVFRVNSADNSENLFGADKNDAFFAKFDNVTKLQTYSQGLQVNGNIRTGNSGDRAIIGRAPITGTTVNNGSTTTVAGVNGVLHNIVIVSDGGGSGGCFAMSYNTGVTKLAGSGNYTNSQNTSSSTNIYKSGNSHAVTLQNNTGSDRSYFILVLASYD